MGYVSNPGGAGGGGSVPENITPLDEDAFAEVDPITDYPGGISIMGTSDTAAWNSYAEPAQVRTERVGAFGIQHLRHDDSSYLLMRTWDIIGVAWSGWSTLALFTDIEDEIANHVAFPDPHTQYLREVDILPYLPSLPQDSWGESEGIGNYYSGTQTFGVSAGANWGPNTGQAGVVVAVADAEGFGGLQRFTQSTDNVEYRRVWTGAAWSAWADVKGAS